MGDDKQAKYIKNEDGGLSYSPHLNAEELAAVRKLLNLIRAELENIASGNETILHHARRYLQKRLEFEERGTPAERNRLKLTLMAKQEGKCDICGEPLPPRDSELDRADPLLEYVEENCALVHHQCHRKAPAAKNYS